ncbi:PAS domain-containing hybrid sensor histidine kinase/response regulator [uncultured Cohaesibacter sp.]|uniref:PAS domain-containing hybrid sensor histidine kinase/response regulator n=1 Tax=uncultured Cohaesibacter sp. TaxID=1002546 RepID=UPI0029317001|nr:PAS domain-containing hybrid sensor histidine kinase/response regulator [uncultured Cohaesibacter sp.]
MLQGWMVVLTTLLYIGLLFAIASFGDHRARNKSADQRHPSLYALSLAVYCTSWTFFGSVGMAKSSGLDFLTIYIGPVIVFTFGTPLIWRIIQLSKTERITSIADFLGARYGKNQQVAAVATLIAVVGTMPYIALQLKAVATSVATLMDHMHIAFPSGDVPVLADIAFFVTLAMAIFAILFGTRHADATEHQGGLILAVAAESVIKLIAFLAVGLFVTFWIFDGPFDLFAKADAAGLSIHGLDNGPDAINWIVLTILSANAVLLLPRQFHVAVVENTSEVSLKRARWMFPLYLVLINLFVIPITLAGQIMLDPSVDPDSYVLSLPMAIDADAITLIAFLGGLSAATAMVIVSSVALAIMISNDLILPLILRRHADNAINTPGMGLLVLNVRRIAILVLFTLAYGFYRLAVNNSSLAQIGLIAFVAMAQFLPALIGGLIWKRANARGAIAGLLTGFVVWAYTLLLPMFAQSGLFPIDFMLHGPFGISLFKPQALLGTDLPPLLHGIFWSILFNIVAYLAGSVSRKPEHIERLQADLFVPDELRPSPSLRLWRSMLSVGDLEDMVARYLGAERTQRSFRAHAQEREIAYERNMEVDPQFMRFAEQLLASAIGAASSRLLMSLLLKRQESSPKGTMKLLDDASEALHYNRDLLQTALNHVRQGIAVFDTDLRLTLWNRPFRDLLRLPADFGQVGTPLSSILHHIAERGDLGEGSVEQLVNHRMDLIVVQQAPYQESMTGSDLTLDIRANSMPDGGIVITFTDVSERVRAERALETANESLERRVKDRTRELMHLNDALRSAKLEAEEASISKTRFLAAAGHDIMQPMNAARLYTTALVNRLEALTKVDEENTGLAESAVMANNIDSSLEAVEDILAALLDIARLDSGAMKPQLSAFPIDEMLDRMRIDFEPMAKEKGLELRIVHCGLHVRSDRHLLRRLLQNLISNAIKYTPQGRVLVGCRRFEGAIEVQVHDTGVGIPEEQREQIFLEFQRLDEGARIASGLGLGLSIVDRISKVLDHPIRLMSAPGEGSAFAVKLPAFRLLHSANRAETPPSMANQPLSDLCVLCVDNEPLILDGMRVMLEGWGCEVSTAASLEEAEKVLEACGKSPDGMLLDYHLDEMLGTEACEHLRNRFGQDIAASLITADRTTEVRDEAKAKAMAILNKPVKPAQLRALLNTWNMTAIRKRGGK